MLVAPGGSSQNSNSGCGQVVVAAVKETIVPAPCGIGGSIVTVGVVHAGSAIAYCIFAAAS